MSWNGDGWVPEQVQTDSIPIRKPRRSRASAKKAGATFEREVADFLAAMLNDDRIDRRVKTGRNDRGDIGGVRTVRGARITIEAKNVVRIDLAGWMGEAELEAGNDDSSIRSWFLSGMGRVTLRISGCCSRWTRSLVWWRADLTKRDSNESRRRHLLRPVG